MNRIFLVAFFATIVPLNLISAEPSAFGAGNLKAAKPYGLTTSEEVILQNKKNLKKVVVKSNNQANEVDSLRERIDGLQSIIESLSRKSRENKLNLKNLDKKNREELNNTNEYENRLSEISQTNSQEIREIKLVVEELSNLVEEVNATSATFVTKSEFNTLVDDFNRFKVLVAKELKKGSSSKKSILDKMSNAEVAKKAKVFYDKKYYSKGIEYYTHLIAKNYKPARSHYMVGEMKYYRKNYAEAIAYYKKSHSLYKKASYMPTLMLHTAISMERTGDKKNAKSFYNGVISKYPNSKHSKIAKNNLSKIR